MEMPISYEQITACAEREIQHHLDEAAAHPSGGHAADIHLGAAIGAFNLWRCLIVDLGVAEVSEAFMSDAQRLEALVRLTSLYLPPSSANQGNGETA